MQICEDTKFIIITVLCKYISLINNNYEDEDRISLFTNKIIEELSKFNNIKQTMSIIIKILHLILEDISIASYHYLKDH